ncbi:MAG: prepilin-type N-terminal cleavage/methylation domain-containing protein [bacterium]
MKILKKKIKKLSNTNYRLPNNFGFTLVELLITISMFVLITGVVLVNSNKFDNTILLHNFTYDIALTIKQAQSYSVNVKENISGSFNSETGQGYGVYFDIDTTGSKTNFILFNDLVNNIGNNNPDKKYNNEPNGVKSCPIDNIECLQKYSMKKGTFIKSICSGANEINCTEAKQLSILFYRPKLDARIYIDGAGAPQSYARIVLSSTSGATSSVIITSIGQIYVKNN